MRIIPFLGSRTLGYCLKNLGLAWTNLIILKLTKRNQEQKLVFSELLFCLNFDPRFDYVILLGLTWNFERTLVMDWGISVKNLVILSWVDIKLWFFISPLVLLSRNLEKWGGREYFYFSSCVMYLCVYIWCILQLLAWQSPTK